MDKTIYSLGNSTLLWHNDSFMAGRQSESPSRILWEPPAARRPAASTRAQVRKGTGAATLMLMSASAWAAEPSNNHLPYRVMTVCTGNICRSPMAEIVLRDRFTAAGLSDRVLVDSTGVSDEETGNGIDRRARRALLARGYDVDAKHRARRVQLDDLSHRNLILPMTARHASALRRLASRAGADPLIRMYRSFDPDAPQITTDANEYQLDVADPWYGGPEDFETCLDEIEGAADAIVAFVLSAVNARVS